MQNQKQLIDELSFLGTLKSLAMAYEDISIIRMQQTRATILQARVYITKLKEILESIQREGLIQNIGNTAVTGKKKKPLATVIITANTKFHGDIIRKIFDTFSHSHLEVGEVFLIGSLGKELMAEYDKSINTTQVHVSDIDISMNDLKDFLHNLLDYEKINVYYAIFKNIVEQTPSLTDIANVELLTPEEIEQLKTQHIHSTFLFEPSVKDIRAFVNDNAVGLLLLQTIYETQLARFASRMKAMDALIQKIDDHSLTIKHMEKSLMKSIENTKQQERITGISLWQ